MREEVKDPKKDISISEQTLSGRPGDDILDRKLSTDHRFATYMT
jgi:hypothetical protein